MSEFKPHLNTYFNNPDTTIVTDNSSRNVWYYKRKF